MNQPDAYLIPFRLFILFFCTCLGMSGCGKVSGDYYFIDFGGSGDIKTIYEDNIALRGLVEDRPFPLISEFSDGDIVIRFEVNPDSYGIATRILAMDDKGNALSISPIELRGPCHFFQPVIFDDDSIVDYVWAGCQTEKQVASKMQIVFTVAKGTSGARKFEVPFRVTANGRWAVYDTL